MARIAGETAGRELHRAVEEGGERPAVEPHIDLVLVIILPPQVGEGDAVETSAGTVTLCATLPPYCRISMWTPSGEAPAEFQELPTTVFWRATMLG